jgi:hypothetical protein
MAKNLEVVFDPSLLIPPSHLVLDEMFQSQMMVEMTEKMSNVMFSSKPDYLPSLLTAWVSEKMQYEIPRSWLQKRKSNFMVIRDSEFVEENTEFGLHHITEALRRHTDFYDPLLGFVSDEISLALWKKIPILATQTSSWKIVQILEKIGAKVNKEIIEDGETKQLYLNKELYLNKNQNSQKASWRKALAKTTGVGFIWLIGGPSAEMTTQGVNGISAVIEDP